MQQTCSRCGAVAPVPSKFCRNCGAPLANEPSEAATRHYGRQTPAADQTPQAAPFTASQPPPPPSVADALAADTSRLHQQSHAPQGQPSGAPPMYQPGYSMQPPPMAAPKSSWWKWLLGFVLVSFLVCGGLLTYTFQRARQAIPSVQQQVEEALREAERAAREGGAPAGGVPGGVPSAPGVPPPPPPPGGELTIEHLRYPKSEQTTRVNVLGNQVLELKTADNLAAVRAFYEKLLGAPLVESQERGKNDLVFQRVPFVVTISLDYSETARLKINIVRSGWIPKLGENAPKQ